MSPPRSDRAAEAQAWAQPYIDRWAPALLKFAASYTGNRETAQEVVQETFLRLLLWHDRHPARDVRPGWLFTVARHAATDLLRKGRSTLPPTDRPDPGLPLEDIVVDRIAVRNVLDAMGATDRECLLLFYFAGLSTQQVAQQLRISQNSVKTRLVRARRRFSEGWEARRHGEELQ